MHSDSKKIISFIQLAILLIMGISFNSCSESPFKPWNPDPDPDPVSSIIGTWVWQESCGGGFYECTYADSVDYTISYIFENDSVVMLRNDSLISIEPYTIVREPMDYSSDTTDVLEILFNDGLMVHRAELLFGDTLRFYDRFVDEISQCWCYNHLYVR